MLVLLADALHNAPLPRMASHSVNLCGTSEYLQTKFEEEFNGSQKLGGMECLFGLPKRYINVMCVVCEKLPEGLSGIH